MITKTTIFDISVISIAVVFLIIAVFERLSAGVEITSNPWFLSGMVLTVVGYFFRKKVLN